MDKRGIIIFVFALVIGLAGFMLYKTAAKLNQIKEVTEQLAKMPQLPVIAIGENKKTSWQNTNQPTIILFFNSECGHCQYEATAIQKRLQAFNRVNLLFISEEEDAKIETFSKAYKLDKQPNIWWLKMKPSDVYNTFGNIGVPHIWVYNKEGNWVKEFRGETKVEALLEWM